jgi:aminomethyltransferase
MYLLHPHGGLPVRMIAMSESENLQNTPLYTRHMDLGARMAPFGGYRMPMQYTGILAEHAAARSKAAVFDTCHMGEIRISGSSALESLEHLLSCDLAAMVAGQCRYGLLCNMGGGVIDDLVVYRLDQTAFMLVVNAGTRAGDFEWIAAHVAPGVEVRDISDETAKVDVQGPEAPRIMQDLADLPIAGMGYYRFRQNRFGGRSVLISRSGYTGEVGFEIYGDPDTIGLFWDACLERGAVAAGLGARNTLRLEVGLPLYGHELTADRNAADAGLTRFVSKTKEFIGSSAIRSEAMGRDRLVGLSFEGRQAAREGNRIVSDRGAEIGIVTSGSFAPSLGHAVALGYVDAAFSEPGMQVISQGRVALHGRVDRIPFYPGGTARKPLDFFL